MQTSYMEYAMSVIISRALPDVRDGLKPVQRRILYAMQRAGATSGTKTKKSAAFVGDVMKLYHPHGDSAIYDALVRMAQPFSLRYPLIDGQGNARRNGGLLDWPRPDHRPCAALARAGRKRSRAVHRLGAAIRGKQGQPRGQDRRARLRAQARRNSRLARRVRPERHAHLDR